MLAAALAQIPHVVAEHGRAYEDCDQEMLLLPATTNRLLNPLSVACGSVTLPPVARCAAPEFSAGHREARVGVIFQLYRVGRNSPNL
jgi:hypothetical protein